jgi:hypothetical protein
MSQNDPQPKAPAPFWPKLIVAAFVIGGMLWVCWMTKFIRQTKENKGEKFFVPMNTNPQPIYQTPPTVLVTNRTEPVKPQ